MGQYESGGATTAPTATADKMYCQLWNTASSERLKLRELGFTNTVATACKIALKRTTARGTNTTTVAGTPIDSADGAATGTLDLTYSGDPTVSGNYLRRAHLAAVIGAGISWAWWNGGGLVIPTGNNGLAVVVPTAVAGQVLEAWAVWEE